ncbi:MAG TPA: peptide-methionine (S)-S-oxide reductase MsrA [Candidatus Krumholzibacteria bacterium]|nr:peptide-methionine (S)-S-oxide reductase MsrA [Candidatus Krumholzibacteria bacterium]
MRRLMLGILIMASVGIAAAVHAADANQDKKTAIATFAGGCFWCIEGPFDDVKGVKLTTSGYTGGSEKNPTYQQVSSKQTGHCEALEVEYDPARVTYAELLEVYWHNIDPTAGDHQFCDWGPQYRPVIFYHDDEQKRLAEASRAEVEEKFGTVAVKIEPAGDFWPAEEYHQDFYMKEPDHYSRYRKGCGRDKRLEELWGKAAGH